MSVTKLNSLSALSWIYTSIFNTIIFVCISSLNKMKSEAKISLILNCSSFGTLSNRRQMHLEQNKHNWSYPCCWYTWFLRSSRVFLCWFLPALCLPLLFLSPSITSLPALTTLISSPVVCLSPNLLWGVWIHFLLPHVAIPVFPSHGFWVWS